MFSKNEKISLRQLKRLIIFDLFGVLSMITPYVISSNAGYDGLGAFLFAAVLLFIYLLILMFYLKQMDMPYLDLTRQTMGRILGIVFALLYLIKFSITMIMLSKLFTNIINSTILSEYSSYAIIIPFIAAAGYMAYKGIEVRARYTEVLYFIVLVPVIALLLFTIKDIDIANLTPVFAMSKYRLVNAGFLFFLLFNMLELLLFIKPYVKPKKPSASLVTGMFSYTLQGIALVFAICVLVFTLTVGLLGENASISSLWSAVSILQLAQLPWSLLNRQDSILIALWLLTTFSALSGLLYYMSHIMKHIFNKKSGNTLLPFIMIIILVASIIPMDINLCFDYYMKYMMYIGLPQSILLPLIVIIVNKLSPAKRKMAGKTAVLSITLLILTTGLCSCANQVEVEDRDFVQVIGVDYSNDNYMVYYALPDPSAVSDQPSSDKEQLLRDYQGTDLFEIEELYRTSSEKKLDYRHLKAIVIGENLAKDREKLQQFIRFFENHYEVNKNTLVYLTNSTVWQVMNMNSKLSDGLGDYLTRLNENNMAGTGQSKVSFGTLLNDANNTDMCIHIPIVTLQLNGLTINGDGVVYNSMLMTELSLDDSKYTDLLRGYGSNNRLFLNNPTSVDNTPLVIRLSEIHNTKTMTLQNGMPHLLIRIEGKGRIEQGDKETLTYAVKNRLDVYKTLEQSTDAQIKQQMESQIQNVIHDQRIDYLNALRMSRYLNRDIYLYYKDRTARFLDDLTVEVAVDISLNHY